MPSNTERTSKPKHNDTNDKKEIRYYNPEDSRWVMSNNLRYYGLGAYVALVAAWTLLDKIELSVELAIGLLAPVAAIIAYDVNKHKNDKE